MNKKRVVITGMGIISPIGYLLSNSLGFGGHNACVALRHFIL